MHSFDDIAAATQKMEKTLERTVAAADKVVVPVRHTLFKRFPVMSVILIAIGVSATATAAELIFVRTPIFREHPVVLLVLGLGILIFMGKLHQKLG